MKHLNIRIYGRVQGVGYRYFAKRVADQMGVWGFVDNMPDGSVYLEVEAAAKRLDQFLSLIKLGPNLSRVDKILVNPGPLKEFKSFEID